MQLLAADTATFAQAADENLVSLIQAPFTPSEQTVIGDLELADFDGSTAKEVALGTQAEGLDPATADAIIDMIAPAGGWRWETTGTTNLPQTIYGYCIHNNAGTVLFASAVLDTPITLTAANQVVILESVRLRQLNGSIV